MYCVFFPSSNRPFPIRSIGRPVPLNFHLLPPGSGGGRHLRSSRLIWGFRLLDALCTFITGRSIHRQLTDFPFAPLAVFSNCHNPLYMERVTFLISPSPASLATDAASCAIYALRPFSRPPAFAFALSLPSLLDHSGLGWRAGACTAPGCTSPVPRFHSVAGNLKPRSVQLQALHPPTCASCPVVATFTRVSECSLVPAALSTYPSNLCAVACTCKMTCAGSRAEDVLVLSIHLC